MWRRLVTTLSSFPFLQMLTAHAEEQREFLEQRRGQVLRTVELERRVMAAEHMAGAPVDDRDTRRHLLSLELDLMTREYDRGVLK